MKLVGSLFWTTRCLQLLYNARAWWRIQTKTEALLLTYSGQYVQLLVSKKLDRPQRSRHVIGRQCLCQFVERRLLRRLL